MLNIQLLVLKLIKKCNATCTHCAAIKNQKYILPLEKAKEIIDKTAKYVYFKCNIIFHGGEPMLIEPEYYDKLLDYTERNYPGKFYYSMQSNFLLYNDEWHELIEKYNIKMNTSYDFFCDIRNINGDTKLYYDIWYKNIKTFQERMSKKYNTDYFPSVINVVNKQNKNKAKEIYEISKKEKFNMIYEIFYKIGRGLINYKKYEITNEEFLQFLKEMFFLYIEDLKKNNELKRLPRILIFDYFANKLIQFENNKKLGNNKKEKIYTCPWKNDCGGSFLSVEPNGNLYNCDMTASLNIFPFGNIFKINDLIEITKTQNFKNVYNRRFKLPTECLECKYFNVCQGGCMASYYVYNKKNDKIINAKSNTCYIDYHIIDLINENINIFKKSKSYEKKD